MRGDPLDRRADLRSDPQLLSRLRASPDTLVVPVWRQKNLIVDSSAALFRVADASGLLDAAEELVFLGSQEGTPYLLAVFPDGWDGEAISSAVEGGRFEDLFRVGHRMPEEERTLLAYARGMAHWHAHARYDPKTGEPTESTDAGFARVSTSGAKVFPRTDPAVMILIEHDDAILLARQPRFPPGMFSALAGFVEVGESLEECVEREAFEEVGLRVRDIRYLESQPWPFPQSLMIGFQAAADRREFTLDQQELQEARWVTRDDLRAPPPGFSYPPPISLAHQLIRGWLESPYRAR